MSEFPDIDDPRPEIPGFDRVELGTETRQRMRTVGLWVGGVVVAFVMAAMGAAVRAQAEYPKEVGTTTVELQPGETVADAIARAVAHIEAQNLRPANVPPEEIANEGALANNTYLERYEVPMPDGTVLGVTVRNESVIPGSSADVKLKNPPEPKKPR